MKDYLNYYENPKKKMLYDGAKIFDIQLKGLEGKDVLINDKPIRAIIRNHTNDMNEFKEERIIAVKADNDISRGDIVNVNKEIYIIISDVDNHTIYYSAKMQSVTKMLKFMSKINKGKICEYPAIIDNQNKYTLGILEKADFSIGNGRYSIIFPANADTLSIKRDDKFMFNHSAWKVADNDSTTRKGLVCLMLGEDKIDVNDDEKNEIANRWQYEKKPEFDSEQDVKPNINNSQYIIKENMGFNIKRFNTNSFWLVKKENGQEISRNFTYKINYNGVPESYISVKEVDSKLKIKNAKCKNDEVIVITLTDTQTNKEVSQDIKLINMS